MISHFGRDAHPIFSFTSIKLLGLLSEGENIAAKVLNDLGVELSRARIAVEKIIGRGEEPVVGEISMTPRSIVVIGMAGGEAHKISPGSKLGPEHLLLGIVQEGEGIAAGMLKSLGAPLQKVQAETFIAILSAGRSTQPTSSKSNVVTCRIDAQDLDAIDALVEAGVRNTRSDAASWLIHAGIEANKALLEKVYGTVAEIRRLRIMAQSLAQEGAEQEANQA
jgi:ATP-dependent Clp protease ATP-binding subunit ClpA